MNLEGHPAGEAIFSKGKNSDALFILLEIKY